MIRAAFFDVDGTLLSHKTKSVPESTREALAKLREKGILCIIATGRQYIQLGKLPVGDIPFDAYITVNGQMTVLPRTIWFAVSTITPFLRFLWRRTDCI